MWKEVWQVIWKIWKCEQSMKNIWKQYETNEKTHENNKNMWKQVWNKLWKLWKTCEKSMAGNMNEQMWKKYDKHMKTYEKT